MTTLKAKIYCMALAGSIGVSDTVTAGEAARLAAEGTFSVVERGAHHRTWQRDEAIQLPNGTTFNRPHKYVELATGMHFWDGQWRESRELGDGRRGGAAWAASMKALRYQRRRSRISRHLPGIPTDTVSRPLANALPGLDSPKGAALPACATRQTTKPRRERRSLPCLRAGG